MITEEDKQTIKSLPDDDKRELAQTLGVGTPTPEDKHNVHSFLFKVVQEDDTTKLGNLTADEVGLPTHTLRTYKECALIAGEISNDPFLRDYYNKKAENLTSTSLSKDAKLINLAVLQKRQIEDVTKPIKENKGWFKPKEQVQTENS